MVPPIAATVGMTDTTTQDDLDVFDDWKARADPVGVKIVKSDRIVKAGISRCSIASGVDASGQVMGG